MELKCLSKKIRNKKQEAKRRETYTAQVTQIREQVMDIYRTSNQNTISKNDALRLASNFMTLVKSPSTKNFREHPNTNTIKLMEHFLNNRSELYSPFFLCDGDTRILFTQDDVFSRFGYEVTDILYNTIDELLIPLDELREFQEQLQNVKNNLVLKAVRRQYFNFPIYIQHKPNRGKNNVAIKRSKVMFSGCLSLTKKILPTQRKVEMCRGNGKIFIPIDNRPKNDENPDHTVIFGAINDMVCDIPRQFFTMKEYILLMDLSGLILTADQRISTVLGRQPCEVMRKSAHQFIFKSDLRLALYTQLNFLKSDGVATTTTVNRLVDFSGNIIYTKNIGLIYEENGSFIFKLTVIQLHEIEGKKFLNEELERIPIKFQNMTLENLKLEVEAAAKRFSQKYTNLSLTDNAPDQYIDQDQLASPLSSDEESGKISESLPSFSSTDYHQPTLIQQSTSTSSLPLSSESPQILINQLNNNYLQPNNNNGSIGFTSTNVTQFTPITMYIPVNSVLTSNQTMLVPNQQTFRLPSTVVQPQSNSNNWAIHTININIANDSIMKTMYSQQPLIGDQLPAEGPCVNLIPLLENDCAQNDLQK